jgi:hypothetical protein
MRSALNRWSPRRRRRRRRDPLHWVRHGDLDIARPAPHDMSDAGQARARARIEALVDRLAPRAIDAGSREVLNNLINAWMDQESARVSSHHLEQTAVSAMLIGAAREEVARRRHRYEADYARAQHACRTLAVTYQQLTGRELTDLPSSPHPVHVDEKVTASTLGVTSWTDTGAPPGLVPAAPPGGPDPADRRPQPMLLTEFPALPMPRDGSVPPARNGTHVAAQADPGDSQPDRA